MSVIASIVLLKEAQRILMSILTPMTDKIFLQKMMAKTPDYLLIRKKSHLNYLSLTLKEEVVSKVLRLQ